MNFRNISAWSIRNPVVPIVMFLGLTLAGIVAFMGMKVQDQPDIEFPLVIVTISQPGAAPTEIENQITQRIESAVRTIAGVDTLTSTATEGSSQTMVQFAIGTDINAAVNEVKNAVDQVRGDLPDGILEPQVIKAQTSSEPIAYFAVSADDMTIEQLSWFIDDTVRKRLLSVPGMAEVERNGGVNREIAVTLDPMRMKAQGVTATQINAALRQVNLNAAGGRDCIQSGCWGRGGIAYRRSNSVDWRRSSAGLPFGCTIHCYCVAALCCDRFGDACDRWRIYLCQQADPSNPRLCEHVLFRAQSDQSGALWHCGRAIYAQLESMVRSDLGSIFDDHLVLHCEHAGRCFRRALEHDPDDRAHCCIRDVYRLRVLAF